MDKRHPKSKKPKNLLLGATIAITVATMLVVIAIVTFVIAANNQTVNSNLSVSYYANNVSATVTGSYQKSGDTNPTTMTSSGNNSINFYATEARTSRTFDSLTLTVDAQNPYVLFIYSFRNNATRDTANNIQGYDVRVSLANNAAITGFTTYYYATASLPSGTLTEKYDMVKENGSTSLPSYQYAYAQRTIYYMMLVEITNLDFDASYADSELGGISWTLDHIGYKDGLDPSYDPNDYVINNDGVLTAYEGSSSNLVIPNTATSINMGLFQDDTTIESVSIPSSVTNVGDYAFSGCTNLESVTFESGSSPTSSTFKGIVNSNNQSLGDANTTTIGTYAFCNCDKLATLILPNNLTAIPYAMCAMYNSLNTYLTSITIPNSVTYIDHGAFYGCSGLTSVTIGSGVTSIGNEAFTMCSGLTSITIPNGVTSIGNSAFSYCSGLTSITVDSNNTEFSSSGNCLLNKAGTELILGCKNSVIPNTVTTIRANAFDSCTGLTSITIPNSVTSIGSAAFAGCSGLTSLTIPSGVTSIGINAFPACSGLTSITVDSNNTEFSSSGNCILNKAGTTLILGCKTSIIPNTVTSIGAYAFFGCTGLTSITIPSSVTSIGDSAFYNCSGLTSITIPSSVTSIGMSVFYYCTGLTSITIPNSVTSIGMNVFYNCSGLTSITIPNSVTSIGQSAFWGCSGLTSITIPNSVTSIGRYAFYNCSNLTSATFTVTSGWWYSTSNTATSGTSITVTNTSTNATNLRSTYTSRYWKRTTPDNYFVWNGTTIVGLSQTGYNSGITDIVIPSTATAIGSNAFRYIYWTSTSAHSSTKMGDYLTSIVIGNSVTSIGYSAFRDCTGLKSVSIGISVTSIEVLVFCNCSGLTSFTFTSNPTNGGLYWYCGQSQITNYNPTSLASLVRSYDMNGYGYGTSGSTFICCIIGDTLIAMADGSQKRIDEIVVGDEILSYNMDTGEVEVDYVDALIVRYREIKVTITFTDGTSIKVTNDHPLLTTLGWKSFDPEHGAQVYESIGVCDETFAIGDKLLTLKEFEGMYLAEFDKTIASIDVEHYTDELYTMYTLRTRNNHTYFSAGVLSHNTECPLPP